jgi:hypothetical protein
MIRAEARIPRVINIQVLVVQQFVPFLSANLFFFVQSRPSRALEPQRALRTCQNLWAYIEV